MDPIYILRGMGVYVAGRGKAGTAQQVQLPELSALVESYRGAGMAGEIEIFQGLQPIEMSFQMSGADVDVLRMFGVVGNANNVLRFEGVEKDETGRTRSVEVRVEGLVKTVSHEAWQQGQAAPMTATVNCRVYQMIVAGQTLHDIDLVAGRVVVNGTDLYADVRTAAGQ